MLQNVEAFLVPPGFEAYKDCLVSVPPALQGTGAPDADALCPPSRKSSCQTIAPSPIWIRALGVIEDTEETLVQLAFRDGMSEDIRTIWCDRWQIAAKSPLVRLASEGLPVTDATAGPLSVYLMTGLVQCAGSLPRHVFRSRVGAVPTTPDTAGWILGREFIGLGNHALDPRISTPITEGLRPSAAGSLDAWLEKAQEVSAYGATARWLIYSTFAAPLLNLLNQHTFIIHHYGPGSGKTGLARMAQTAWGDYRALSLPVVSPKKSLAEVFHEVSDLPILFDNITASDLDIATTVADLTSERGRPRAKNSGGKNRLSAPWRTVIRFTGEAPLLGKNGKSDLGGQWSRVLQISLPAMSADQALSLHRWLDRGIFGHAGPAFLRALTGYALRPGSTGLEQMEDLREAAAATLSGALPTGQRALAPHYAMVAVAQALATHFFFGKDLPMALAEAVGDGVELIALTADAAAQDCAEAKALQVLHDHMHQHRRLWIDTTDSFQWEQLKRGSYRNLVGVITPDEVWLIQRAANDIVRQAGLDPQTLWKGLASMNLLQVQPSQSGYASVRVIGGFSTRCYVLRRALGPVVNPFSDVRKTEDASAEDGVPLPPSILSQLEKMQSDN